jgi:hypothetical protein
MAKGWSGIIGTEQTAINYINGMETHNLAIDQETGFLVQTLAEFSSADPNDYYVKFTYPIANITLHFNRDSRTGKIIKPLTPLYYPAQLEAMNYANEITHHVHLSGNTPDWGTGSILLPSGVYHVRLILAVNVNPEVIDNDGVEICNPYFGTEIQFNGQNKNF